MQFPEWYPLCSAGFAPACASGELLGAAVGRHRLARGFVRCTRTSCAGQLTTPKNHQRRRVDLSRQLQTALRLWRASSGRVADERAAAPEWVFASVTARRSTSRMCGRRSIGCWSGRAHRRGPHQMRHTFASLLLQDGAPITYVSRQLGHRTRRSRCAYTRTGCRMRRRARLVDRLDDDASTASQAHPATSEATIRKPAKSFRWNGEPPRNRTENPQIKSLLLCQLS